MKFIHSFIHSFIHLKKNLSSILVKFILYQYNKYIK